MKKRYITLLTLVLTAMASMAQVINDTINRMVLVESTYNPVIAGAVKQFWTEVIWEDVDYMFVDMPPGTGDVPLTVFQSLPVDGMIVVTSPQDLVSMIVGKAVRLAELMNKPILGLVENYSYFQCPNCNEKHYIYGESKVDSVAEAHGIKKVGKL